MSLEDNHSLLIAIKEINLKATAMTILEAGLAKWQKDSVTR